MKSHRMVVAFLWKLVLAGTVLLAGPESHLQWVEKYDGPGMNQWDLLVVVIFFSIVLTGALGKERAGRCPGVRRGSPLWDFRFGRGAWQKKNGKAAILAALQDTAPRVPFLITNKAIHRLGSGYSSSRTGSRSSSR